MARPLINWFFCAGFLSLFALAIVVPPPAPTAPPPPEPPEITLLGVGDILLGRQLGPMMAAADDYTLPMLQIGAYIAAADITFGNLEGPFCERPPYPSSGMVFRVPPRAIESLLAAGFDAVSVANNHFADGGEACMRFTLDHLRAHGIAPGGAGLSFDEAHAPAIVERSGVRFAFLAYTYAARNDRVLTLDEDEHIAAKGKPEPGGAVVAGRRIEQMQRDVTAAREQADVVIVSLHDGAEYTRRVLPVTERFARAAIEAGAVAVLGHHPHVPQRVERHAAGWIFYSLGNFVFQQKDPGTRESLVARLVFRGAELVEVEAVPVVIDWFSTPRLATSDEAPAILSAAGLESSLVWRSTAGLAAGSQGAQVLPSRVSPLATSH